MFFNWPKCFLLRPVTLRPHLNDNSLMFHSTFPFSHQFPNMCDINPLFLVDTSSCALEKFGAQEQQKSQLHAFRIFLWMLMYSCFLNVNINIVTIRVRCKDYIQIATAIKMITRIYFIKCFYSFTVQLAIEKHMLSLLDPTWLSLSFLCLLCKLFMSVVDKTINEMNYVSIPQMHWFNCFIKRIIGCLYRKTSILWWVYLNKCGKRGRMKSKTVHISNLWIKQKVILMSVWTSYPSCLTFPSEH